MYNLFSFPEYQKPKKSAKFAFHFVNPSPLGGGCYEKEIKKKMFLRLKLLNRVFDAHIKWAESNGWVLYLKNIKNHNEQSKKYSDIPSWLLRRVWYPWGTRWAPRLSSPRSDRRPWSAPGDYQKVMLKGQPRSPGMKNVKKNILSGDSISCLMQLLFCHLFYCYPTVPYAMYISLHTVNKKGKHLFLKISFFSLVDKNILSDPPLL